ncbi:MAG: leucine-rich repeat protein, partial [Lachnospiraceae bacterium]|nr:leucine-rich repeat protein [Lachnospiraceae bacterium]
GITSLSVPKSVISIGDSAFNGCTALADVTIPKNTISIGASAFAGCTFTDVTINSKCSFQTNSFPFAITDKNYY